MNVNVSERNVSPQSQHTLVIDIGNTEAKAAVFQGEILIARYRTSNQSLTDIGTWAKPYACKQGIISTVINLTNEAQAILNELVPQLIYLDATTPLPFTTAYQRDKLGSDRIAAIAGIETDTGLTLVIDLGTCITYDVVYEGKHLGGNISPGIRMRLKAMHDYTSRLPEISHSPDDTPTWGTTTIEAMRAGVLQGITHEILGYAIQPVDKQPIQHIVLTGGDAADFAHTLAALLANRVTLHYNEALVLNGLNRILLYNGTH